MKTNAKANPKFPDTATGRTKHFAFNWIGGGYNDVYARDKEDAIIVAEEWVNTPCEDGYTRADLRVDDKSVYEISDEKAYQKSLPYWD
jgi:hypothetical protein